jgi:transposase
MKLSDLNQTERKVLKAVVAGNDSAKEIAKAARVHYGYTRVILTYLRKLGLIEHRGDAHQGTWKLSEQGKEIVKG